MPAPVDDTYTKKLMAGNLGDSPAGGDVAASALLVKTLVIAVGAAGTAGTPLAASEPTPIPFNARIRSAYFSALTGVTANGANYGTVLLAKYDAAGANKTTVATRATDVASIVALKGEALVLTPGADLVVKGGSFTVEVTKTGSGVATPAGNLVVELEERSV